jgi:hypothetical protein
LRLLAREHVTSALRFWEPARLLYNLVLLAVVLVWLGTSVVTVPRAGPTLGLIVLAAAANLVYCLAYPVDLFVQTSDFRDGWRRFGRPLLFVAGLVIAVALALLSLGGSAGIVPDLRFPTHG